MELRQLRYFVGVTQAGSLLKASAALNVAQPALSQQMAALEAELDTRLFDRSSRGVTLTDAGRVFLAHARVVLADVDRARDAVMEEGATPRGDVAIGLPTTVGLAATLAIVSACRAQLPQVRLKVVEAYSGFLREWLLSGRLDMAILFGDAAEAGLAKEPMLDEELVLVAGAAGTRLPDRLPLSALTQWPLVLPGAEHGLRKTIDEACARAGVQLQVVAEIEALSSVKLAAQAGIGATILSPSAVAQEVAQGLLSIARLDSADMTRRIVLATNATRPGTRAKTAVQGLVREEVRRMVLSGKWPARWLGEDPAAPARA